MNGLDHFINLSLFAFWLVFGVYCVVRVIFTGPKDVDSGDEDGEE